MTNLRRVAAVARKELISEASYKVSMMMRIFSIWYFAISFYFIGELVGTADPIQELGIGYFEFVLVGSIVTSFAIVGLSSFPAQIEEEQDDGTLEAVFSMPTPIWPLVVGSFIMPMVFVVLETVLLVALGLGVFGDGVPILGLLKSIPILLLTMVSFAPFGILSAAFLVLVKRGEPFSGPARQLTLLLSGALYPVSILPGWLEVVAHLVPATYGVRAVRALIEDDAAAPSVVGDALILIAFTAVLLPIAIFCFRWAITTARRAGTLATY